MEPTEEIDPNKFHVLSGTTKKLIVVATAILVLIIIPLGGYSYYKFAINRPNQTSKEITYEIKKGASIIEIGEELQQLGAVNSPALLGLYVKTTKSDKNIQAGTYVIPAGTNMIDLVKMFEHGTNDKFITFIEGWRIEEFALEAAKNFKGIDYEDFVEQAKNSEGLLYPDTYSFNVEVTEEEMIKRLRDTFDQKARDILTENALAAAGLTYEQAIVFASLVERESFDDGERGVIAGILINRWKGEELVGADATTQYIAALLRANCSLASDKACPKEDTAPNINWWPTDLTVYELEYDSPYNTRAVVGLPPKPISGFGLSALKAVVYHEVTDYKYYLHDNEGNIHLAETNEDHVANKQLYLGID